MPFSLILIAAAALGLLMTLAGVAVILIRRQSWWVGAGLIGLGMLPILGCVAFFLLLAFSGPM